MSEIITLFISLGIALPKIIETLFIVGVLVCVLGFKVWPYFKKFFEDITVLRITSAEAVVELSNTLKEPMVQAELRMQQGTLNSDLKQLDTVRIYKLG